MIRNHASAELARLQAENANLRVRVDELRVACLAMEVERDRVEENASKLRALGRKLNTALELESAALEQACAAPVDGLLTPGEARALAEVDAIRAQLAEAREALELYADSHPAGFGEVARRALAKMDNEVTR